MLPFLPFYIPLIFMLSTILTIALFYKASKNSIPTLLILIAWLVLVAFVGESGFFTVTNKLPPRLLFFVALPLLFIATLFFTKKGQTYLDRFELKWLTLLHSIRILVELVLFWLFLNKAVPEVMTFEGRNFDILAGLTAPFVYHFGAIQKKLSKKALLLWNLLCLALLLNIIVLAVFSAPFPFQKIAFDQPNIAVLYFPFVWLPCCVVPLVLLSHFICIRSLHKR